MGVTKNDSTMKAEADQAQRKNLEVENQQDKMRKTAQLVRSQTVKTPARIKKG